MQSKFYLPEDGHYVPMLAIDNINGGKVTDVVSMEKYSHADIVVQLGANTVGGTVRFTVEECDDFTPTNSTPIAFGYVKQRSAAGDTPTERAAATVTGVKIPATVGLFAIASIDSAQLSDGYENFQVTLEDPGAATYAAVFAVLSGPRYASKQTPTAIA